MPSFGAVASAARRGAADPDFQRAIYGRGFYRTLRGLRWAVRYDCRYRLLLMERLFHAHGVPFERLKVFELGFGVGDLLRRFDDSCRLHGCELSQEAIDLLRADARFAHFAELSLALAPEDGDPVFPDDGYDLVIASHVIEHVPDDRRCLRLLAQRVRPGGHGLFFLPLEKPWNKSRKHARIYTAAGFLPLLRDAGWTPLDHREVSRFESLLDLPARGAQRLFRQPGKYAADVWKHTLFSLLPPNLLGLMELPLALLQVSPRQLVVLARRAA